MNKFTGTPVNTVVFDAFFALVVGLLVFAGPQAINAVFTISITALYIAYAIPIVARFAGKNDFKPGPFSLGVFVRVCRLRGHTSPARPDLICVMAEPARCGCRRTLYAVPWDRCRTYLRSFVRDANSDTAAFQFPATPQTSIASMNYTIVVLGGVLILSLLWYYAPVVGGVHWFQGPVANIGLATADNDSERAEPEKGREQRSHDGI